MSTTRITASRGADLSRTYTWPDTTDLTGYTGTFKVYDNLGGNTLLTVTTTPNGNGSSLSFVDNTLTLFVAAADLAALAVATPTTDPAVFYYDLFIDSGSITTKFQGGAFVVPPIGATPPGADTLDVSLNGDEVTVNVAAQGGRGDPGGNVDSAGLFTSLSGQTIPAGTDRVHTSGHATAGYGPAWYVYDIAVDAAYVTANPYTSFRDLAGRGFRLDEEHPTPHMFGGRGDGATPYGARLNAWLAWCAANSKIGHWPKDGGAWRTDQTLAFADNTHIVIAPGVTIEGVAPAARIFQFSMSQNCSVVAGRGVTLDGRSAISSSVVYLVGAKNTWIEGITAKGSKAGKDAYYVGGTTTAGFTYCEGIRLIGCKGDVAGRNTISIVSCVDFHAYDCDFTGAGVSPGAGCDIEANSFDDTIRRITFEKCKFHDNGTWGTVVEFGTDCTFIDCDFYNNQNAGFGVANGGNALTVGVRRADVDIMAVTAVNAGAGKLTLSSTAALRVGMLANVSVRGAGVRPTGAPTSRAIIYSISGNDVQFYNAATTGPISSFSDSGSGTLTSDPETSEIYVTVYQDGASNNIKLINSRVYGNCLSAGAYEVYIATCADVRVEGCDITATKAGVNGINAVYSRKLRIRNNHILSTIDNSGAAIGMSFGLCYDVVEEGNTVRGFAGQALNWSNSPVSQFGNRSIYSNSGMLAATPAIVECTAGAGGRFTGATLRQDGNHTTTYGANFSGWTSGLIDGCDFTGVATSNTTALRSTDTSMVIGSNVMWDGTTQIGRTGSKTYDAPSIANGGTTSTTVTVTGAKLGDRAHAALGLTISGLALSAYVSATNTVTVVLNNNTGGAVDLASTTLYASAQRIAA